MAVPLTAALVALIYLCAVPWRLALCLRLGPDGVRFGVGAAPFEARFARARALSRRDRRRPSTARRGLSPGAALRAAWRAAAFALRRVRFGVDAEGEFGAGDAAVTALVCGGAMALERALRAAGWDARLRLKPDFSGAGVRGEVTCMISARAGHIMAAALLGAWEYATGRFAQWTDTPSRAL